MMSIEDRCTKKMALEQVAFLALVGGAAGAVAAAVGLGGGAWAVAAAEAAAVLLSAFLWGTGARGGWQLARAPQFYCIPVGLAAILFAEANRGELGRGYVNGIRSGGMALVYLSLTLPMWQFQSLGAWATLLLLSLAALFAGIGLRAQAFVWFGLGGFAFALLYQAGRAGFHDALARWALMLALGLLMVLFVALSEKQRLLGLLRHSYEQVRSWE